MGKAGETQVLIEEAEAGSCGKDKGKGRWESHAGLAGPKTQSGAKLFKNTQTHEQELDTDIPLPEILVVIWSSPNK